MEPEPTPDHETPPVQRAPSAAGGVGPDHTFVSIHRVVLPAPAGTGCLGGLIISSDYVASRCFQQGGGRGGPS